MDDMSISELNEDTIIILLLVITIQLVVWRKKS